jgi:hypothetical protein
MSLKKTDGYKIVVIQGVYFFKLYKDNVPDPVVPYQSGGTAWKVSCGNPLGQPWTKFYIRRK